MEPTIELSGIDMNDRANIAIYTQLIRFQADFLLDETLFHNPGNAQQRIIHELAHSLGLEFEYSLVTRAARISKPAPLDIFSAPESQNSNLCVYGRTSAPASPTAEKDVTGDFDASGCKLSTLFNHSVMDLNHSVAETSHNYSSPSIFSDGCYNPVFSPQVSGSVASQISSSSSKRKCSYRRGEIKDLFNRGTSVETCSTSSCSGYQEIIFDSCSGTSISSASISSGRRGSMDIISRAAMKAVKAIGACWRCKFLRKTCDTDSPCLACPKLSRKPKKSNWEAVGCKRGEFRDEMPPLKLCPRSKRNAFSRQTQTNYDVLEYEGPHTASNATLRSSIALRNDLIESIRTSDCPQKKFFEAVLGKSDSGSCWKPFHKLQWPLQSCESCEPFLPAILSPLDECIVAILWETTNSHSCRDVFMASKDTRLFSVWDLAVFLRFAASYQAKLKSDELILLSLTCLRNCLETLSLSNSGHLEDDHHQFCAAEGCKIDSVSSLEDSMGLYLDELQRVFFKKENMRSKETWWLSAFYSLAIQGFVRKALLQIARKGMSQNEDEAEQYLQVAVRLFNATSGTYDPLMRDYALARKEKETGSDERHIAKDFQAAQLSLQQYKWVASGTSGSTAYLKKLYEDDREQSHHQSLRETPQSLGWPPTGEVYRLYKFIVQKGKEPYFELLPGYFVTPSTPEKVYLDPSINPKKGLFPCRYPNCNEKKVFKRSADLERHYRNVHAPLDQKDQYLCDYAPCLKFRGPFTRKDHFRDHLRDYHKEDIGVPKWGQIHGEEERLKLQESWVAERNINHKWWRCPKCLDRVVISESGYECPTCKLPHEEERVKRVEKARRKTGDRGGHGDEDWEDLEKAQDDFPDCNYVAVLLGFGI